MTSSAAAVARGAARTPLLCDALGIVWVVGHRIADRVKVTEQTEENARPAVGAKRRPAVTQAERRRRRPPAAASITRWISLSASLRKPAASLVGARPVSTRDRSRSSAVARIDGGRASGWPWRGRPGRGARPSRGSSAGFVVQAVERLNRLFGPAGTVEGQAQGVLVFDQPSGSPARQPARGLEPPQGLEVQLGLVPVGRRIVSQAASNRAWASSLRRPAISRRRGAEGPRVRRSVRRASSTSGLSRCVSKSDWTSSTAARRRTWSSSVAGRLGAPDPGGAVDAARGELAAVAADRQADDPAGVPAEREDVLAGLGIPELDGPVVAGGGQAAAVGEVRHGGHQARVALEPVDEAAGRRVPDHDLGDGRPAVLAADRGEEAAVGGEGHVLHAGRVPAQGQQLAGPWRRPTP